MRHHEENSEDNGLNTKSKDSNLILHEVARCLAQMFISMGDHLSIFREEMTQTMLSLCKKGRDTEQDDETRYSAIDCIGNVFMHSIDLNKLHQFVNTNSTTEAKTVSFKGLTERLQSQYIDVIATISENLGELVNYFVDLRAQSPQDPVFVGNTKTKLLVSTLRTMSLLLTPHPSPPSSTEHDSIMPKEYIHRHTQRLYLLALTIFEKLLLIPNLCTSEAYIIAEVVPFAHDHFRREIEFSYTCLHIGEDKISSSEDVYDSSSISSLPSS